MTTTQLFYQDNSLKLSITGAEQQTLFRQDAMPIAQRTQSADEQRTMFFSVGPDSSPLQIHGPTRQPMSYTPYGHTSTTHSYSMLIGFNGEHREPVTKNYLLASYRLYSPTILRFYSPDSISPFSSGGLNAYAYCEGDPINFADPTGHMKRTLPYDRSIRPTQRSNINQNPPRPAPARAEIGIEPPGQAPTAPSRAPIPSIIVFSTPLSTSAPVDAHMMALNIAKQKSAVASVNLPRPGSTMGAFHSHRSNIEQFVLSEAKVYNLAIENAVAPLGHLQPITRAYNLIPEIEKVASELLRVRHS